MLPSPNSIQPCKAFEVSLIQARPRGWSWLGGLVVVDDGILDEKRCQAEDGLLAAVEMVNLVRMLRSTNVTVQTLVTALAEHNG